MTESGKTGVFWLVASVVVAMAAIVAWPRSTETDLAALVGKPIFENFNDVLDVSMLKIDRFDEELGQLSSFEVTRDAKTNQWSIPSHDGYPADATEQIRDAATAFLNLEILDVASEVKDDHEKFGVLEPNASSLKVGDEGVGRLVQFENDQGEVLVNLIIGSMVKDSEDQRFVRIPTQDVTYVVKFDDKPLTTKFDAWIEDNLLDLSSFDIQKIGIRDYSIVRTLQGASMQPNFDADVVLTEDDTWQLDKLDVYEKGKPVAQTLADDQELDGTKLGELRSALDDLKIVDVRRKPDGLSGDLKADSGFMKNDDAVRSLITRGFYPQPTEDGKGEVFAANGELIATLKNGVEYLLRFGEIDQQSMDSEEETEAGEEDNVTGVNRYLLVTARVNEATFPEPELQTVPETWEQLHPEVEAAQAPKTDQPAEQPKPAETDKPTATEPKDDAAPADTKADEADKPATEEPKEESKPAADSDTEPAADDASEEATDEEVDGCEAPSDDASDEAEPTLLLQDEEDDQAAAEAAKPATETDEKPAAEEAAKPAKSELTAEEKQEELEVAQESIRKANQRKLDERNDQLEEARKKVRSLNERFADWYYVVPESEYRKIHLSRDNLIKQKEPIQTTPAPPGN
ncbi:hypothetical protein Poly24_20230 [Rosistilla carotiformis]|uniref:DUF4340 domain-containing protein n=1 Tax=Rosistilla carotiformis TaxID=2528017 RepID=A0A518JRZ7_9BACT|nr:DUF4340 domain-containing protein [Rosistilla carotiformis]QDV68314.1 hypothetical protein Poly24_20230 [Rosistilla carotiformis]